MADHCRLFSAMYLAMNLTGFDNRLNKTIGISLTDFYNILQEHVDVRYLQWLVWLIYPLLLTVAMPLFICSLYFGTCLFLHIYALRRLFMRSIQDKRDFWDGAKKFMAIFGDYLGKVSHSYEVIGIENIPLEGPALLIYYHGALPLDLLFLMSKVCLYRNRYVHCVGDKFLFKIPGLKLVMEVFNIIPGTVSRGVELMKEGHLLSIAPGGTREAYFSTEYYKLLWGNRIGFAKIASQAKVVRIITLYSQMSLPGTAWLRRLYEKVRLPIIPVYGGFPVKWRTFVGEPIQYDPSLSPEQLALKVQSAVNGLIHEHQRLPGNILQALLERFRSTKKYR